MDLAVSKADHLANEHLPGKVHAFVDDAPNEYVFQITYPTPSETASGRTWRAVTGGVCYIGFESRLEALVFVSIKKAEALSEHLGLAEGSFSPSVQRTVQFIS